jgi:hypothetical protein
MSLVLAPLRGDVPVSYMAALGLLRVVPEGCRLSWDPVTKVARMEGIERDELLDYLALHMRGRHASPELVLTEKGDVRGMTPDQYQVMVAAADEATLAWVRCWWREDGDKIIPTDLCLTGGPQRFIKLGRELAEKLDPERNKAADKKVRQHFEEALFGPWLYKDAFTSWGWDPSSYRPGATTHEAPTKMNPQGVAAAYWLAWESQLLFPCLPGKGTLGFQRQPRRWNWVTWQEPLDRHAVKALLRQPEEALSLGGARLQSRIINAGQYQFMMTGRVV